MSDTETTVMGGYHAAVREVKTAMMRLLRLLERTFSEMYPDGAWLALYDDPDEREVTLGLVLDAAGNIMADITLVEQLPEVSAELVRQWEGDSYRSISCLNDWLDMLYQADVLDCDLPAEFLPNAGLYRLVENRPCLRLRRSDTQTP